MMTSRLVPLFLLLTGVFPARGALYAAELIASPPVLRELEDIRISWTGIQQDPRKDTVTVSCGPTNDITDFLFQQPANASVVIFSGLVNLRCDYVFRCVCVRPHPSPSFCVYLCGFFRVCELPPCALSLQTLILALVTRRQPMREIC